MWYLSIAGPAGDWLVFHCQRNALQYSNKNKSELRVFSFESDSFTEQHGQRYFLVASSDQFWHYYKQLTSAQRHHYEVIAEGKSLNFTCVVHLLDFIVCGTLIL